MKSKSLSFSVTRLISVVILLGGLFVSLVTYYISFDTFKNIIVSQLNTEASILTTSLSSALWTYNQKAIDETANYILSEKGAVEIVAVKIIDSNGKNIFEENKEGIELLDLNNYIRIEKNISYGKEVIGNLIFWADTKNIKKNLVMIIHFIIGTIFLVVLLVISFTYLSMKKLLKSPLAKLRNSAEAVLQGNQAVQIDSGLEEEFHFVVQVYNSMFSEIARRDEALKSYNQNLELLVQERTKEIEQQKSLLLETTRMATLGEFAGNVAHEINNPLSVIMANANFIHAYLHTRNFEKIEAAQKKIVKMVDRIGKIINGLRSFARDGSKDPMFPFDVSGLFEVIKDLSFKKLDNSNIVLKTKLDEEKVMVYGREVQFSQVLMNLINNAADAIENLSEKWIELSCMSTDSQVIISVTDSGLGIPVEIREKMMRPFFTTKEIGKGTGLGLSICLGIINEHSGSLVYDESSLNTRFIITIPKYISSNDPILKESA